MGYYTEVFKISFIDYKYLKSVLSVKNQCDWLWVFKSVQVLEMSLIDYEYLNQFWMLQISLIMSI